MIIITNPQFIFPDGFGCDAYHKIFAIIVTMTMLMVLLTITSFTGCIIGCAGTCCAPSVNCSFTLPCFLASNSLLIAGPAERVREWGLNHGYIDIPMKIFLSSLLHQPAKISVSSAEVIEDFGSVFPHHFTSAITIVYCKICKR